MGEEKAGFMIHSAISGGSSDDDATRNTTGFFPSPKLDLARTRSRSITPRRVRQHYEDESMTMSVSERRNSCRTRSRSATRRHRRDGSLSSRSYSTRTGAASPSPTRRSPNRVSYRSTNSKREGLYIKTDFHDVSDTHTRPGHRRRRSQSFSPKKSMYLDDDGTSFSSPTGFREDRRNKSPSRRSQRGRSVSPTKLRTEMEELDAIVRQRTPVSTTSADILAMPSSSMTRSSQKRDDSPPKRQGSRLNISPRPKTKSLMGNVDKLDAGYRLILHPAKVDGPRARSVFVDLDPGKIHLRVHSRGDKSGSPRRHVLKRLRIKDILRLEIGRITSLDRNGDLAKDLIEPARSFAVVIRGQGDIGNYFHFEAESLVDRDAIISGLKELLISIQHPGKSIPSLSTENQNSASDVEMPMEQASRKPRGTLSPSKRTHIHVTTSPRSDHHTATPKTPKDQGTETSLLYYNFEQIPDVEESSRQDDKKVRSPSKKWASDNNYTQDSRVFFERRASDMPSIFTEKEEGRDSAFSFDDFASSSREQPLGGSEMAPSERDMDSSLLRQSRSGDSGFMPSQLDAHTAEQAAISTTELANMANQVTETWCTDDICSLALSDFANACQGFFVFKQHEETNKDLTGDKLVENYLSSALGSSSAVANLLPMTDEWIVASAPPDHSSRSTPLHNRIKNRVCSIESRTKRLELLRKEMSCQGPNELDPDDMHQHVVTTMSSDDLERVRLSNPKDSEANPLADDNNDLPSLFDQMISVVPFDEGSATNSKEDVRYYDSDPEHFRPRKAARAIRKARYLYADPSKKDKARRRRKTLSGVPMHKAKSSKRVRTIDEQELGEILEYVKNEKMLLTYHRAHDSQTSLASNPQCVNMRIEHGMYLMDGSFILPKLSWVVRHEPDLSRHQLNMSENTPGQLELLDVCRVRVPKEIDRKLYPFARGSLSFIVQTQEEKHLFEAPTKEERDRIVIGLKLVIARLASLLMLRDMRAVEEFFGAVSVPGEAPAWAK